ncbi:MAG TPA: DegT/DnrJ/EryC1/StrS family aminotransferase [Anaerolineaceae bacterium]|nr:DegT/DnrJ/EryC1/StrS family aminotransferase [Anaerolineaceae bacterium]
MQWTVPLADLDFGPEEDQAVLDVLHRKWLTMGAVSQAFEQEFAAYHGAKHAIAVSNATQALHLACLALGIGPGDEVIVPSLTFVATSNAVLYTGAEVRFADIIGPAELTIDPADIEQKITPRTKAIIAMHYGGFPCRMPEIMAIAQRHGLHVIEDAAHAPGAWLNGKALGTWGEIGCFSFFSNKNLSTGEGGMLLTAHDGLAEKLRLLRSHGMTSLTWDRHQGHAYSYDVVALGYNDRIDEIRSALGRVQLAKLAEKNDRRRRLTEQYWQGLAKSGLELPFHDTFAACYRPNDPQSYLPAHHLMPVLLPEGADRLAFVEKLKANGIQTSLHYPPTHRFSYFQERFGKIDLPRTEAVANREVTLPLWSEMGAEKVQQVIDHALR